ncbi:hypothetical protein FE782_18210 [Paenibacillus antri]|uniref:Rod shape-determining protein MreD n=2 Tax=Paenibacillus antri TaxID=2582848 RepID=A0A5R9G3P6_9BACL|nr:hypothetical protein FE782_18210 [Paenibacillus antri]
MIAAGSIAFLLCPKRLAPTQTLFGLLFGVVAGLMFDHTIAVPPFDLYDVGDQAAYTGFDIFSYLMYAPFGYFFIYFLERRRIRGVFLMFYIVVWVALALLIEYVGLLVGLFHYKEGYLILYSIPIYTFLQSILVLMNRTIFAPRS